MREANSNTIEQILFDRMGVTIENAIAAGADFVDDQAARAGDSGVDVDERLSGLTNLFGKLSEPATILALSELLKQLPQLAQLAKIAVELPKLLAIVGDVVEEYQQKFAADGIDVEKALTNGLNAVLYLGSEIDHERLQRIDSLLSSEILNPNALNVIANAVNSLHTAQTETSGQSKDRIGIFGMLAALRDPQVQRSLAFAVEFGKCFGKNLDTNNSP
ncbi:DUF1641 domain-containing protein [bacterium]|nr:DUF1641 domain-containing protein [bacterium]